MPIFRANALAADPGPIQKPSRADIDQFCKYVRSPETDESTRNWLAEPQQVKNAEFRYAFKGSLREDKKDVLLYEHLLAVCPDWRCIAQQIGDCVSFGWMHGTEILIGTRMLVQDAGRWPGRLCTEAAYGLMRVEAFERRSGGWGDGAYGGAAAKAVKNFGIVPRKDYSGETGISEHDVRKYSGKTAKNWGNYGCGGKNDKGLLDKIARLHPIKSVSMVRSFEEAGTAISNGYPIPVCSGQGFSSNRDSDGFCKGRGSWGHCMCFIGVRYGKRPGLLCMNSWGHSVDGPRYPDNMPDAIAACTWWVDVRIVDRMLSGGDSFAVSNFSDFRKQNMDLRKKLSSWLTFEPASFSTSA